MNGYPGSRDDLRFPQVLEAINSSRLAGDVAIDIAALYPKYIRLPAVSGQPPRALGDSRLMAWHTMQDLSVVLKAATATKADAEWWALRQTGNDTSPFGARQGEVDHLDIDIDIYIDTYVSLHILHRV